VAREAGMGTRINTIMQTCFFAISGVLPRDEAIAQIKKAIRRPMASAAKRWCRRTLPPWMRRWRIWKRLSCRRRRSRVRLIPSISGKAPEFVRNVLGQIAAGHGDCCR
jgi:pyruvate-ferredoxin/flavodoxin oxidoreductase